MICYNSNLKVTFDFYEINRIKEHFDVYLRELRLSILAANWYQKDNPECDVKNVDITAWSHTETYSVNSRIFPAEAKNYTSHVDINKDRYLWINFTPRFSYPIHVFGESIYWGQFYNPPHYVRYQDLIQEEIPKSCAKRDGPFGREDAIACGNDFRKQQLSIIRFTDSALYEYMYPIA